MQKETVILAFNEWMREYIEEPEKFQAVARSITEFLAAESRGKVPSYGDLCEATLRRYMVKVA